MAATVKDTGDAAGTVVLVDGAEPAPTDPTWADKAMAPRLAALRARLAIDPVLRMEMAPFLAAGFTPCGDGDAMSVAGDRTATVRAREVAFENAASGLRKTVSL